MEDILEIMNNITILLKYFIPGAICIKLFSFLYYKTENDDCEYFIFKSIILSGIIVYPLETIYTKWNDFALFATAVIIGVLICYIISKILGSDYMQKFLQKLHIRKTTRSFWDDVIDLENGSYAEVKVKEDDNLYLGYVEYLEEKMEGDIYISISGLTIMTKNGDKSNQDANVRLIINTANVERLILKNAQE